jgi:cell division protein FtsB
MRFILKQVHLYFPFVFPMMWIPSGHDGLNLLVKNDVENKSEILALQKQLEEFIARIKKIEAHVQKLEEGKVNKVSSRRHNPQF